MSPNMYLHFLWITKYSITASPETLSGQNASSH